MFTLVLVKILMDKKYMEVALANAFHKWLVSGSHGSDSAYAIGGYKSAFVAGWREAAKAIEAEIKGRV